MKTRLQRFLADCGVASRREAEAMILAGRVQVNGRVRSEMPVMIDPEKDVVTVDEAEVGQGGERGLREQAKVYVLLNKPKGILVTRNDPSGRKTVNELITGVKERLFPVGRLDMDSRGALLMTNDGDLANRLTHPRFGVEKTYVVEVDGKLSHEELERIKHGVWLGPQRRGASAPPVNRRREQGGHAEHRRDADATRGRKTEAFRLKLIGRERGRTILELRISEAKNSDIRRVMARIGHNVRDLNRVAIGGKITTRGLEPGEFRRLTESEVKWLYHASSPEYHARERAATQSWYEAKEMEKERKRLRSEPAEAPAPEPVQRPEKAEKKLRERPVRKGKKPFVPPSGRNAGKLMGGNYLGRQRLEREQIGEAPPHEDAETIKNEVRAIHPLGDAAASDE